MNKKIPGKADLEILVIADLHYGRKAEATSADKDRITHLAPELIKRCQKGHF